MFKTACAVLIVTTTWNIVMAVFDVSQNLVNGASGVIVGNVQLNLTDLISDLPEKLRS